MVVAGSGVEFIAGSRTGPASRNIRSALCIVFLHCGFGGLTRRGHPTPVNLVVRKHSLLDLMKIDHDFGGDSTDMVI